MKRNSVTKKILSLVMCMLMVATIVPLSAIQSSAVIAGNFDTYTNAGITHVQVIYKDNENDKRPGVDWKNGAQTRFVKHKAEHSLVLHCVSDTKGGQKTLAYCVSPGVAVIDTADSPSTFTSFSNEAFTYDTGSNLTGTQIDTLVRLVMAYGYPTGTPRPADGSVEFYKAYATQLLIWEIVTGERNSDFTHNGSTYYALNMISTTGVTNDGNHHTGIKEQYNNIEAAVLNDIKRRNQPTGPFTNEEKHFDLGTIELEFNPNNFCYEGTVQNDNIKDCKIPDYLYSSNGTALPKKYISIDNNTGTLKVSIPILEAFYYQQESYYGDLTKVIQSNGEPIVYVDTNSMATTIYKGALDANNKEGQQMIVVGKPQNTTIPTIYYTPYRLSFTIKVPETHRHNWIPHRINPTCTTQGLMCWECTCGRVITSNYDFTYGSSDPTKFDFKTGIAPAEGHDKGVTVTTVMPTCSTKGETQTLCTKCGVVIGSSELPQLGHTKEGEGSVWVVSQEPTAEAKGEMSLLCGRCGAVQKTKEIKQHTHDNKGGEVVITASSCATDGMKGTLCSACGAVYNTKTVPAGHSDKTVKVTNVAATCTKNGEASILCTTCGEILDTEVIPALGHTDDDVWFTAVEPTCTADGEIRKLCTRCGEVTDAKAAAALGHDDGVWTTTIEPTCELDGEQVLNCTRCGKLEDSKPIAKLGHDNGAWRIDIEATADHDGSMNLYCTRCGMVQNTKAFGLHTHEKGYTKTLLQATCTRDGEQGTVCAICNAIFETEKIAATGHSYLAPYQNGNGTHSMKCENCDYVYTQNCSLVTTDYANSCTNIGYRVHVCTLCGYNYTDGFTKAMGHDYEKWTNYNASSHVRYCTRCPVAEYTLHVWSPYYFNGDETVMEPGTKTKTCIYCGTEHTIEGEDSSFATAVNVTINSLEFSLRVLEFFNKIMAGVKKVLSVIFGFIR